MEPRHTLRETHPDRETALAGAIVEHLEQGLGELDEATLRQLQTLRKNALAHAQPSSVPASGARQTHREHGAWLSWLSAPRLLAGFAVMILGIGLGFKLGVQGSFTAESGDTPPAASAMSAALETEGADDLPDDISLHAFLDDGFSLWLQENTAHSTPRAEDSES